MKGKTYDKIFRFGMIWRIGYGTVRMIVGLILLRHIGTPLSAVFARAFRNEFFEDPRDHFIHAVGPFIHHFSFEITYFLAIYLIFWGLIDVFLSIQLLRLKLWAFPLTMWLIALFIVYEVYRYTHTHSIVLLGIILIDLGLIWLINGEYRRVQAHLVERANVPLL
ncbi:MAG: rane protein [Parcubacteria group bacterium]|nr:rane protein [Parcubacteria group bacterium]